MTELVTVYVNTSTFTPSLSFFYYIDDTKEKSLRVNLISIYIGPCLGARV